MSRRPTCKFWGKGKAVPKGWTIRKNLRHGIRLICRIGSKKKRTKRRK